MTFEEYQATRSEFRAADGAAGFYDTTGYSYADENGFIECDAPDGPYCVTIGNSSEQFAVLADAERHLFRWMSGEMGWTAPTPTPRWSHAFTISFAVETDKADWEEITDDELIDALQRRIKDVVANGEMGEACGPPWDSCEED